MDVGDTLVDERPELDHYCRVLSEHGYGAPKEAVLAAFISTWAAAAPGGAHPQASTTMETYDAFRLGMYASLAEQCGFTDAATVDVIVAELMAFSHDHLSQLQLFLDAPEVLTLLAERYRLATMSNWHWGLSDFLTTHGIRQHFELVVTSGRVGYRKPHPEIFNYALNHLKVGPEQVVMVGDSYESDVLGAQGVGIPAILVDRWGVPAEADCPVIQNLSELPDLLASM